MVHTQRYRYQSPHLNAEKTHFQSIEMKHNTLLYDAILPPPHTFSLQSQLLLQNWYSQ